MLNIDADEVIPPDLASEIRALFAAGQPPLDAYGIRIAEIFPGEGAPHRFAYTLAPVRLYRSDKGRYSASTVHDRVDLVHGAKVGKLKGTIHHFSVRSLGDQMAKLNAYTDAQVADLEARGETLSVYRMVAGVPGQLHQGLYRPPPRAARRLRLHDGHELRLLPLPPRRQVLRAKITPRGRRGPSQVSAPSSAPVRPVAIVTGGGRRIGAAIVRRLAAAGYSVLIHHRGGTDEADALAASIVAEGGAAATVAADLADPGSAASIIQAAQRFGTPALLVNNASLFVSDSLATLDIATWEKLFAVNLRAPALLAQAFAAAAGSDDPSIINIVDQRVWRLTPQHFTYTLTKSALYTATVTLAQALAPRIRVNAVGPGPTAPNPTDGEQGLAREAQGTPMARAVRGEEIAEAVAYLAGARAVTGQMIAVDSGQHIGWRTPDIVE